MIKHPLTPKAEQRQTHLEESLLTLLRDIPYPQITVADICQEAQIPRRTFYHYFDSKNAVLKSLIEKMIHQCSIQVMFDFNGGYDALLDSLTRNFYYWLNDGRTMLEVLLDNNLEGELVSASLKWLYSTKETLPHCLSASGKQLEIITTASVASFFAILHYWRVNDYQDPPEDMAVYTANFLAKPLFCP